MTKRILTVLLACTLGAASAQTTTAPAPTTLPGTIPASVKTELAKLTEFLAAGGKLELTKADGTVVGTVNADGTVTLVEGATLSDVKSVLVTAPDGVTSTYAVTRDLSKPGAIKIGVTLANGKVLSLPLAAIANRSANANAGGTDKAEKAAKPEKPAKPAKPAKGK
jgi:hypothetical protein